MYVLTKDRLHWFSRKKNYNDYNDLNVKKNILNNRIQNADFTETDISHEVHDIDGYESVLRI